jgi:hypothetical protein
MHPSKSASILDLKICEGCGALWFRAVGRSHAYCTRCTPILAEFPAPRRSTLPSTHARLRLTPRPGARLQLAGGAR